MIRTDSRKVKPGDTFIALKGISSNGDEYIGKAIENGAVKIVCENGTYPVETINTPDTRKYLEEALRNEYGKLIDEMTLVGVTGTNGKTTTCYLISTALNLLGIKCAYIGTIGFYMGEKVRDLPNTSVDICSLYELLLEAYEKGFKHVALEASSQGMDMGRLNTLKFDQAIFTNLTEDHLDYHKTMENYGAAKQWLFRNLKEGGKAIVCADDGYKDMFLFDDNDNYTYGLKDGDYRALGFEFKNGTDLLYAAGGREYSVHSSMIGAYNVSNLLAAVASLNLMGIEIERINEIVPALKTPDGRCEIMHHGTNTIVIDYAHTPDAIDKIISCAEGFTENNIYAVFGCAGDREKEKRPKMTEIVLSRCARGIITVDDIHSENPDNIVRDMLRVNTHTNYDVCLDRKIAIHMGIDLLEEGDTLLVLGKGHEDFIIAKGGNIPHNDKKEIKLYLGL